MEFELRREIEELSRTCSEQQQLIHHVSHLIVKVHCHFSFYEFTEISDDDSYLYNVAGNQLVKQKQILGPKVSFN